MSDFDQAEKASPAPLPQWRQKEPDKLPDADNVLRRRGDVTVLDPAQRVVSFPGFVELGEQIVESQHHYPLVTPKVHANAPFVKLAAVHFEAAPAQTSGGNQPDKVPAQRRAEAFSPAAPSHDVLDKVPIPIQFWPRFVGDHEVNAKIFLRWEDEVTDLRTVRVHGRARRAEDAPIDALGVTVGPRDQSKEPEPPTPDLKGVEQIHITGLENAYKRVYPEAQNVADRQGLGLDAARADCLAYEKKHAPMPWWASIAEIAITMAIGGVASAAAKVFGGALHSRFESLIPVKDLSQAFWIDSVKEGLKWAGKKAMLEKGTPKPSSNKTNAFFELQGLILGGAVEQNRAFVLREYLRVQQLLLRAPAHAVAIMSSLHDALVAAKAVAYEEQIHATTAQWLSLIGRSENGSETIQTNGQQRQTTKLDHASRVTEGILRIEARNDGKPTAAQMLGVSQELADRIRTEDLSRMPMPLLIFSDGGFLITRDEVGRVRIPNGGERETQRHRDAQEICKHVLSKSLATWGVAEIETDDATGRYR